jgi:hypothetical protein
MKRFLGFAFAMFFALVGIALVGGDSGAVAGHGCHGRCHGGLLARLHRCHGEREKCHGLFGKHRRGGCHGAAEAAPACEPAVASSDCGSCGGEAAASSSDCGSCGGGESVVSSGCSSCGGESVVSEGGVVMASEGGCVGGACGGESVISEGAVESAVPTEAAPIEVPTPAAPAAPAAPEAPAAPAAT